MTTIEERTPLGYDLQIVANVLREILAHQTITKTEHHVILHEQAGYDSQLLAGILGEIRDTLQKPSYDLPIIAALLREIKEELQKPESLKHVFWNFYWKAK